MTAIPVLLCSVFLPAFKHLEKDFSVQFDVEVVPSSHHLKPELIDAAASAFYERRGPCSIFCFGECSLFMQKLPPQAIRLRGPNCVSMFLGAERYKDLLRTGAYFVLNDWLDEWESIFSQSLGFHESRVASMFASDTMKELIYLDMGLEKLPYSRIEELAHYLGLPWRVENCDCSGFKAILAEAVENALKVMQ